MAAGPGGRCPAADRPDLADASGRHASAATPSSAARPTMATIPNARPAGRAADLRELTPSRPTFAEGLALEWLERIAGRAPASSADGAQARFALDLAWDPERVEAQGIGNIQRQILKTLARNSWLARVSMTFAERFVVTALIQVTRYLSDDLIRALAQKRVLDLLDDDTRVIIGHSLGSVVAYESAHRLAQPLPLLLTLGSPLGIRTIVADRLRPSPSFPPKVDRWVNVADRDDIIAAEPDLRPRFASDPSDSSSFQGVFVDNGCTHSPVHYLGKIAVGGSISQALA